jgi:hypothetical protein
MHTQRQEEKKLAVQSEKKLNGLVVEGCLDKQMIISRSQYKLLHKIENFWFWRKNRLQQGFEPKT